MSVWDVDGRRRSTSSAPGSARCDVVSHCYRRPRHLPLLALQPVRHGARPHARRGRGARSRRSRDLLGPAGRGARRALQHPHPEEDRAAARAELKESDEPCFASASSCARLRAPTPLGPARQPPGPVVIWNLIRRCNLTCKHCYSISADVDFPGELSTAEVFAVMDDLKALRRAGADPVRRRAAAAAATSSRSRERAKAMGFYVGLSTNGTLIDDAAGRPHRATSATTMSASASTASARRMTASAASDGAYRRVARAACGCCRDRGIKVGLRFTVTERQCRTSCRRCSS